MGLHFFPLWDNVACYIVSKKKKKWLLIYALVRPCNKFKGYLDMNVVLEEVLSLRFLLLFSSIYFSILVICFCIPLILALSMISLVSWRCHSRVVIGSFLSCFLGYMSHLSFENFNLLSQGSHRVFSCFDFRIGKYDWGWLWLKLFYSYYLFFKNKQL